MSEETYECEQCGQQHFAREMEEGEDVCRECAAERRAADQESDAAWREVHPMRLHHERTRE